MRRVNSESSGATFPSVAQAIPNGESVRVSTRAGVPVRLEWRGRLLPVVAVEASWCVEGRWWLDENRYGLRRRYLRLHLSRFGERDVCVEVFLSKETPKSPGEWRVWRVAD